MWSVFGSDKLLWAIQLSTCYLRTSSACEGSYSTVDNAIFPKELQSVLAVHTRTIVEERFFFLECMLVGYQIWVCVL